MPFRLYVTHVQASPFYLYPWPHPTHLRCHSNLYTPILWLWAYYSTILCLALWNFLKIMILSFLLQKFSNIQNSITKVNTIVSLSNQLQQLLTHNQPISTISPTYFSHPPTDYFEANSKLYIISSVNSILLNVSLKDRPLYKCNHTTVTLKSFKIILYYQHKFRWCLHFNCLINFYFYS